MTVATVTAKTYYMADMGAVADDGITDSPVSVTLRPMRFQIFDRCRKQITLQNVKSNNI
jgi:hypothetical protein